MKIEVSRSWLVPTICLIIAGYFAFHSIQGARGYRRMNQVKAEIVLAKQVAAETHAKKEALTRKVRALSPESLDLDLLEERASRMLNVGSENDKVILLNR